MKHLNCVSKRPKLGVSNFEAKVDFLVRLTEQAIEFIFILTD